MEGKILEDIRKLIGGENYGSDFDKDLKIHINTALFALNQMGIGVNGFYLDSGNETWSDFLKDQQLNLHAVKTWVYLKVKMIFDPPTSSIVKEAMDENLREWEWRIYITENFNEPIV